MKFTLSWLKKFLETDLSISELSEKLTSIGFEVEEVVTKELAPNSFFIAEIISAEKHPNADSLQVCKVDAGDEVLDIVCGAPNARAGIKVVLAKVGSIIPNGGFKIKASAIRGSSSNGMLCSEQELMTGNDSDGIIELPSDAVVGSEYQIDDDPMFDISVTPDKAFGLGVYGIARDLAAAGAGKLKSLDIKLPEYKSGDLVEIKDSSLSSCFIARKFTGIKNQESPEWLQKLLRGIGKEPISALVDITNYICLTFARPLHVYDASKVDGALIVDYAKSGEKLKALDGNEYELQEKDIVIRDKSKVLGIAGIIGGEESGSYMETTDIILESALFDQPHIANTGRRLLIDSDARYRFERGIDSNFVLDGFELASQMIEEICSGIPEEIIVQGNPKSDLRTIAFELASIKKLLGIDISKDKVIEILSSLGFGIEDNGNNLGLTIPSWRGDVAIKEDIIEEIIRIYGFDHLPKTKLPISDKIQSRMYSGLQRKANDFRKMLAHRGFDEVISWSFMSSSDAELFTDLNDKLYLANPITVDLDYMRPSILPNLLKMVNLNQSRNITDLNLFEMGPIFSLKNNDANGSVAISGLRSGDFIENTALHDSRKVDIYDIKADMDALLSEYNFPMSKLQLGTDTPSYYHPGRSAVVKLGKNMFGYFGEIHPKILKHCGITHRVVAFELIISNMPESKLKYGKRSEYKVSDYQGVNRDFAFMIPEDVPAANIEKLVMGLDNKLIRKFRIFDIYQGDKIEEGYKSVAFNILIQSDDKTLLDEELQEISNKIIVSVETKLGGKIRA